MKGTYTLVTERIGNNVCMHRLYEGKGTNGTEVEIVCTKHLSPKIIDIWETQKQTLESNSQLNKLEKSITS